MVATGSSNVARAPTSEAVTIAAVFCAHLVSHFAQVAFAPVLMLVKDEFGIGFTEAGLVFSLMFLTSGLGQPIAGMLVDRFGAHRLLMAGVFMQALGIIAMGFTTSFLQLLPLAVLVGLGNSVYHPADLSILSRRVARERLGRAFAIHSVAASAGFAAGPLLVGWLALIYGWRGGLIGAGLVCLAVALMLVAVRPALRIDGSAAAGPLASSAASGASAPAPLYRVFLMPVVLAGFSTFALTGLAALSIVHFGVSAFTGFGFALAAASLLVACYQIGMIAGLFSGGFLAEWTQRHHIVAMLGAAAAALLMLGMAFGAGHYVLLFILLAGAGVANGAMLPSRDILLRSAVPPERLGTAFGAVYAGLDFGGLVGPLVYGPLLDLGRPDLIFVVAAALMGVSIFTVRQIRRSRIIPAA